MPFPRLNELNYTGNAIDLGGAFFSTPSFFPAEIPLIQACTFFRRGGRLTIYTQNIIDSGQYIPFLGGDLLILEMLLIWDLYLF